MALISRFTRLFRADLHAVLDRIEEPEVLLRQSVREMQESLAAEKSKLAAMESELESLPASLAEMAAALEAVQEEISLCLDSDNDQLARSKVRRKLELQQREKHLQTRKSTLEKAISTTRERFESNQHRLDSMRQKLEIFCREHHNDSDQHALHAHHAEIGNDDIEVALMREKKLHRNRTRRNQGKEEAS